MSENPPERAKAVVKAVTNFEDANILAEVSEGLKAAMKGLDISEIPADQRFGKRVVIENWSIGVKEILRITTIKL